MMISSQRWDCEGIVDLASLEFGFVYMGDVELLSLYALWKYPTPIRWRMK